MAGELGIPEGVYEDAKRLLRCLLHPVADPFIRRSQRKAILSRFSPQFASHPPAVTSLVDYFAWHEDDTDWKEGNGLLGSVTYGELLHLWTNPKLFVAYEAHLLRFISRGGETNRTFLLGWDLADPICLWALLRTLKRHEALGFKPRVRSVLDFRSEAKAFGVHCDMFGVINGRISYFLEVPPGSLPLMLRTTDTRIVERASHYVHHFWKNAESAEKWASRQPTELPEDMRKQVEIDIAAVQEVARMRGEAY